MKSLVRCMLGLFNDASLEVAVREAARSHTVCSHCLLLGIAWGIWLSNLWYSLFEFLGIQFTPTASGLCMKREDPKQNNNQLILPARLLVSFVGKTKLLLLHRVLQSPLAPQRLNSKNKLNNENYWKLSRITDNYKTSHCATIKLRVK